ncbi:O-antigen ligase family protein [Pontibacter oryzae]|uniref:O-antigen ligase domain-containing protein n=1 Tax=Pontibacter oryzae TaxID=2304593 RepID=A0A399SHX8_9BACT|nr:O-antigen ligase family protein [Pontibacter oryzae]RIJ41457.1 O-antigen ligase domain-containing protein [Pontibacter oryzae]
MIKKNSLSRRTLLILAIYAFILTMPFGITLNSFSIILIVAAWISRFQILQDAKSSFKKPPYILLYLLYALYILSVPNSLDTKAALAQLELKSTLLLFPLVISSLRLKDVERLNFLKAFVGTVTLATLVTLSIMVYKVALLNEFRVTGNSSEIDWIYFSYFLPKQIDFHPPYFSMYTMMAALVVFYVILASLANGKRFSGYWHWLVLLLYLLGFTVVLSSRTALIAGLLILAAGGFAYLAYNKKIWFAIGSTALLFVISLIVVLSTPYLKMKLENSYGINQRQQLWMASASVISENPIFGVGSGDTKRELTAKFHQDGYSEAFADQMDPHNQYVQILLALGFTGFSVFMAYLVLMLYTAFKYKNHLLAAFVLLFMSCAITESTLETQKGIIFFVFLSTLLISTENTESFNLKGTRQAKKIIS